MSFTMLRSSLPPPHQKPRDLNIQPRPFTQRIWIKMPPQFTFFPLSIMAVVVAILALLQVGKSAVVPKQTSETCISQTLPNPIAPVYPNNATGVLNATLAIIPISLRTARRLIPDQYGILEHAYRSLIPDFPVDMYPMLLQAAHDHDIQFEAYGIKLDDFSRVGLEFPFLDLLGDGYSSFRWAPAQLITAGHDIAIDGSRAYGTEVTAATFTPQCDAYEDIGLGHTHFEARGADRHVYASMGFRPLIETKRATQYPLALYKNITNQPTFANGSTCDNMIRLFNTSMSTGVHEPVQVLGNVDVKNMAPVSGDAVWKNVFGIQVATPFIENNYLDCWSMQGYSGTGGNGDTSSAGI